MVGSMSYQLINSAGQRRWSYSFQYAGLKSRLARVKGLIPGCLIVVMTEVCLNVNWLEVEIDIREATLGREDPDKKQTRRH